MDTIPKKEREPFFNFSKPYLTIPHVIVGRKDGLYFDSEKDLANKTIALEGKRVAVVEGYAIHEWLRDAVEVGDLTALSERAFELKARTGAASAGREKIGRLTDGFDFDGLLNLAVTLDKEQSA
jgi:ABC-type amino acid transport substrate-binding protein